MVGRCFFSQNAKILFKYIFSSPTLTYFHVYNRRHMQMPFHHQIFKIANDSVVVQLLEHRKLSLFSLIKLYICLIMLILHKIVHAYQTLIHENASNPKSANPSLIKHIV